VFSVLALGAVEAEASKVDELKVGESKIEFQIDSNSMRELLIRVFKL
jgi:hypothetical protein